MGISLKGLHSMTDELLPRDLIAWSWEHGELSYLLHDAQLVIYNAIKLLPPHVKEAIALCARRFGKSFLGATLGTETCAKSKRRKLVRIIGPTIKQTKAIVDEAMAKLTSDLYDIGMQDFVQRIKSENRYNIGPKSSLFLGGFDSQEDNLRGGEADEMFIEETGFSDPEQYNYQMKSVLKPQLLTTRGRMIHLTTLPRENDHPFITETIPECQLNDSFYSFDIYQNPMMTLDMIGDAIKDCGGADTIEFLREYLNQVVRDATLVAVPSYDDNRHVGIIEPPSDCVWHIIIDQGGTRDFTVAHLMTYIFDEDLDYVADEMYWPANTSSSVITSELKTKWDANYKIEHHYSDCPGQTQVDWDEDHKYPVMRPAKGDWQTNVNRMVSRFKVNKVKIHPQCTFTRTTLNAGRLNKQRNDFARTARLGHCDAAACLMYGIQSLDRTCPEPLPRNNTNSSQVIRQRPESDIVIASAVPKVFGNGRKTFGRH